MRSASAEDPIRIIADPLAATIIRFLSLSPPRRTFGQILAATDAASPTVSRRLRTLRDAGMVAGADDPSHMTYTLDADRIREVVAEHLDYLLPGASSSS